MKAQSNIPFETSPQRWNEKLWVIFFDQTKEDEIYYATMTFVSDYSKAEEQVKWAKEHPEENEQLVKSICG